MKQIYSLIAMTLSPELAFAGAKPLLKTTAITVSVAEDITVQDAVMALAETNPQYRDCLFVVERSLSPITFNFTVSRLLNGSISRSDYYELTYNAAVQVYQERQAEQYAIDDNRGIHCSHVIGHAGRLGSFIKEHGNSSIVDTTDMVAFVNDTPSEDSIWNRPSLYWEAGKAYRLTNSEILGTKG